MFIISLFLILFCSKVLNLLILFPLTSKYVSKLVNCGKALYNLSSNFTNKSLFLHIKLKCPISLFPILTKLTPITLSSCLIEDKSK